MALTTLHANAQTPQAFELDWTSPPECPQGLEVTEQIRAMLGAAPGTTLPSGLHAAGTIGDVGERFQLTLTVRLGTLERVRVIASNDCSSLGKAAALVLGLLIRREHETGRELSDSDFGGEFHPTPGTREPDPPKPSPVSPTPPTPLEPPQTHADTNPRLWRLLLNAPVLSIDFLTLPEVSYGLGLSAGVRRGAWRGLVAATLFEPQRLERGGLEAYTATFDRVSVEGWLCRSLARDLARDLVELAPCALVGIDRVHASASGERLAAQPQNRVMPSVGAGLTGYLHPTPWLGVFIAVTGRAILYRPVFEAKTAIGTDSTYNVPAATSVISTGVEWNF